MNPARPAQTHAGAVEPYEALTEAQREFETNLQTVLKCYAPACRIHLTLHNTSAAIPVTGLACDLVPPEADGVLEWWCTWEQQ